MPSNLVLAAQALALLGFLASSILRVACYLPYALLRCLLLSKAAADSSDDACCVFYEGTVCHERRKPVHNAFRCGCTISLISTPPHQ